MIKVSAYQQATDFSSLIGGEKFSHGIKETSTRCFSYEQLGTIRRGFSTRRVKYPESIDIVRDGIAPRPGDLVLASVTGIGQHGRIELPTGRRSFVHIGDQIVVAYGNRYAPDQFEAEVPEDLDECNLVAAGGIAARMISKHPRVKAATRIKPVGLLVDRAGRVLNLADWKIPHRTLTQKLPPVIAVAGTSMNAGKTTTAARLIRGLHRAGKKVGAAKITGTGAGGDIWQMMDAGAVEVLDFTDAGYASTYKVSSAEIENIFLSLLTHLARRNLDAIVLEIADGILQQESAALLSQPSFASHCNRMLFAASDAMGAVAGTEWLRTLGLEVAAISGTLTASPLAMRETAATSHLPVYTKKELSDPAIACHLISELAE